MFQYIYKDIASVAQYFPYGLAIGFPIAVFLYCIINLYRKKNKGQRLFLLPFMIFCIYFVFLIILTLLSREGGSNKTIDLEFFSTLTINTRNTAYVVENILLFVPYGFLVAWNFKVMRNLILCTLLGLVTSFGIETIQLFTGRGIFQVDDIWTNTVGMIIGCVIFAFILFGAWLKKRKR